MAHVKCKSCSELTPIIPPHYRCKNCNYPLNEEDKTNIKIDAGAPPSDELNIATPDSPNEEIKINLGKDKPKPKPTKPTKPTPPTNPDVTKVVNKKEGKLVGGWLVVHTENKEPVSYDLYEGKNFFGTEAEGYKVDIPVIGDKYVSRSHAHIEVSKDFLHRFIYLLKDDGTGRKQGASLNGTFVNGKKDRLPKDRSVYLRDGDTIQIGETKLVFKSTDSAHDVEDAVTSVLQSDYTKTILLK